MTERLVTERELAGVLARLNALSRRVGAVEVIERAAFALLGSGTSFPTTPPAGAVFFRTDLNMWAAYDGARWLSAHEYQIVSSVWQAHAAASAIDIALRTDYAPYFTYYQVISVVAVTNNGTNFWNFNIQGLNTARAAATGIATPTTAADTAGTNTLHEGAVAVAPTNKSFLRFSPTVTGAPGALTAAVSVWYRLILT